MRVTPRHSLFASAPLLVSLARATILYDGGTIIAWDNSTQRLDILRNASLLVDGNTIVQISNGSIEAPANTTMVDATDKIIGPGYIDTHNHLWQTAFRSIAADTSLALYFQQYGATSPAREHFTPEDLYIGQVAGILELLHSGTTTVLDPAHGAWSDEDADSLLQGTFDGGIRCFFAHTVQELGPSYTFNEQVEKLRALAQDRRLEQHDAEGIVSLGLSFDGFGRSTPDQVATLWNITKAFNLSVITAHHVGGPYGFANSPVTLHSYGILNDTVPVVLSHNSNPTHEEAQLLRETNQYASITP